MRTRTSNNWNSVPGNWDPLKINHIDFEGYPYIGSNHILTNDIQSFTCTQKGEINSSHLIDMFVDDYRLERFWNRAEYYSQKFKRASYVMTPDFSLLLGMPTEVMQWNVYRNRLMGYIFEKNGINVIPTVSWADESSLDFCTKGIKKGSTIAVSNVGAKNDRQLAHFNYGLHYVIDKVQPEQVVICSTKKYKELYQDSVFFHIMPYWDILRPKIKKQWEEEADNQ